MQISLRLLKAGVSPSEALSENVTNIAASPELHPWTPGFELEQFEDLIEPPLIIASQVYNAPASWVVGLGLSDDATLINVGSGAVVFFTFKGGCIAVCFGYSRGLLDDNSFERDFGLEVVVRAVDENALDNIETTKFADVVVSKKQTLSRSSNQVNFDLDTRTELATAFAGTSKLGFNGSKISGNDSLKFQKSVTPTKLISISLEALDHYRNSNVNSSLSWIKHQKKIKEGYLIDELNGALIAEISKIAQQLASPIHFQNPSFDDLQSISTVQFHGPGIENISVPYDGTLSIETYANQLLDSNAITLEDIRGRHRISFTYENGQKTSRSLYRLLCGSVEHNNQTFLITDGNWIRVSKDFVQQVDAAISNINIVNPTPELPFRNESELNAALLQNENMHPEIIPLDKTKINLPEHGYARSQIEPCDYYASGGLLVHIKVGNNSSPLSHLWFQGLVSARLIAQDNVFRAKFVQAARAVNASKTTNLLSDFETTPTSELTIVYSIIQSTGKDLDSLYLFAKIALYSTLNEIAQLGFKVAVEFLTPSN